MRIINKRFYPTQL